MTTKLTEIRAEFEARLAALSDLDALEQVRIAFLGKKGSVTELLKDLKNVSGEEKRVLGQEINLLKRECEERIAATVQDLKAKELERMVNSAESYDITLPADLSTGSYHPITMVRKELVQIFASMGFIVEDYFEVTDDYHCFEALNIPKNHPARDMQDTFYLDNGQLLKTHTSAAQNAIMRKYGAPVRAIFPGRCFRNESIDACHEKNIGFIDMKPLAGGAIDDASAALRYIAAKKSVDVIIPGMATVEEIQENIASTCDASPLTPEELSRIDEIRKLLTGNFCRRCGYCAPCTVGINIPILLQTEAYYSRYGLKKWALDRYASTEHKAGACIECGLCESRCPYNLPIRQMLKKAKEIFGG